MVLQQQSPVKLWGWANPNEKIFITTSWNNQTDSVVTTSDAAWQIVLHTPKAGGPYTITLKGSNTIVLDNVMLGEVWVCSGQSNMEYNYYNGLPDVKAELPAAHNPNIRFFNIPKTTSAYPQDDCRSQWTICDSNTLKNFSAVGYFFGKKLQQDMNVPIGLINASWGGTPAEVWTPASVVNSSDILKQAAAQQKPNPWWTITPGYAYNGMIAPITSYAIAGAIWYQGESNTGTYATYSDLFTSMISAWRKQWNKDFPFYYVQIAPYKYGNQNIGILLREQQTKSLSLPGVDMAVITDLVADTNNIHPTDKHNVGIRLANLALAQTYHQNITGYHSPMYKSFTVDKDKIIINFTDAADGLMVKGKTITPVYIAGEDKVFYPAEAKVKDGQLIVWSKQVKHPVAVRYAFSNTAMGNLFSKEGLPVTPFRTDEWEMDTSPLK
jgi:sialate O-acetylesterase